ncbi:hypothetical protein BO94DRAFT_176928 [Aspergillus sclerotioniger CBS 115572]|uniref:Uncharacterized protein n=1 Tax=Aspergillus sclerotioniger CBS 115572 TaxID=1450535 RepID=A0A317W2L3_9EURO|nr:hypothetical protein BO94DRAFT_176928 [Aspergillus sclerotioniger CBS 115572]PWY78420.1 hypothetical protein BO94DRAFT_176928 [Aspergillus sclerotioniger CBS 115572]
MESVIMTLATESHCSRWASENFHGDSGPSSPSPGHMTDWLSLFTPARARAQAFLPCCNGVSCDTGSKLQGLSIALREHPPFRLPTPLPQLVAVHNLQSIGFQSKSDTRSHVLPHQLTVESNRRCNLYSFFLLLYSISTVLTPQRDGSRFQIPTAPSRELQQIAAPSNQSVARNPSR